ncbi:MBL fold metallo-hydrolase [Aggregatilineales bacterium SYSU G02658]
MSVEIVMMTLGMAQTNAYLVADTATGRAILIDPVDDANAILEVADKKGWQILLMLATHAHFDHVLAAKAIKDATGAAFVAHRDCVPWLERLPEQGMFFGLGRLPEAPTVDRLIGDEPELIELDAVRLKTLYTPGHADGHLAFYMADYGVVFSGDTLFQGSIGRTDLPGGSYERLMQSIETELLTLPDETRVLSGHGQPTTIGVERRSNPFLV